MVPSAGEKRLTDLYIPEFLFLSQEDVIAAGALDMAATIKDVELAYKLFLLLRK